MGGEQKRFDFRVMGPLEVADAGRVVALGGPQQRTLLALLLANANRTVSRDRIVDAIWEERPPASAANAVQVAVHGLRRALGRDRVATHGAGYALRLLPGELDLQRFTDLVERARSERPVEAAAMLREALDIRRGASLVDLPRTAFVEAEHERIEELFLSALEARIDADLELRREHDLVPELERLVAEHPFRERLRAQLMLALYRAGRQAEALETYRRTRELLVEELGVEPSRELQELEAAILRQDPRLRPSGADSLPSSADLPRPPQRLVGRELELTAITSLLRGETRLLTLTGPGGTGKTHLALEVAHALTGDFDGGVHFVDLAPLRDHDLVLPAIARALDVPETGGGALVERISASIAGRATLLVLDNFEHVLDAASDVARLVAHAADLRMLATSREPLRVRAEREYPVPPLDLPSRNEWGDLATLERSGAVALFIERAASAAPGFELAPDNAAAVVACCRALDGLPLALELAAARLRMLSPAELHERLAHRLGALATGGRDLPERHRTLRATFDWSHELLSPAERELFARLAVFSGSWTLRAAETVCDADLATLGSLVEKSLIRSGAGTGQESRFSMLEVVREYALERLAESGLAAETRDRHAEVYADLAERIEPELRSATALDGIEREHDNFRAALAHSIETGDERALRLCAMARFWYVRGFQQEGRDWLERTLAQDDTRSPRRVVVLHWAAIFAWTTGDREAAIARAEEGRRLAEELGDEVGTMGALTTLGLAHLGAGDLVASRGFHEQALELARRLGREREAGTSLSNLADIAFLLGDYDAADALALESIEIARRHGDTVGVGVALLVLATSALEQGRETAAVPMIAESLVCFREVDFRDFISSALVALARTQTLADPHVAARLLGAARAIRAPLGTSQFPWEPAWFEACAERLAGSLGEERLRTEIDAGAESPEKTLDAALARFA